MRLTRLRIKNWRNFKDAEVHLESRAFFVGPNASGKSNLLDVLRFLNDLTVDGGGIQKATSNRGGVGEIRSFAARSKPIIMIEVELGNDEEPAAWTYSLEFNASKDSGRPIVVREIVRRHGVAKPVLERPDRDDNADAARLSETAIEQVSANKNFREIAAFFASIRYLHVIPQIIREPGRSSGHNDPFGGDLIERINATKPRQRDARLKRMEEALRIAVPQLRNLELEIDKKGIPHLRAQYVHWRPQGAWQRQDRFSDGTLRLLGLIWALQESGGPLLLEEPEMSLNAGVVERLAPMISRATRRSGRQVLITTHSIELLSDGVAVPEVNVLAVGEEGTEIRSADTLDDVQLLVDGGVPLGEAVLPKTRAKDVGQLAQLDLFAP